MTEQIGRRTRDTVRDEIIRRADHDAGLLDSKRQRDHVLRHCLGMAQPGIEAAGDNVDHAALADHIDPHVRICLHETDDDGKRALGGSFRRVEPQ